MRGIFVAGVLDALQAAELPTFDIGIGASAGACNLASYLAGQQGRNLRCYTRIMSRPRLFSAARALVGGHYMDLDWLWERFVEEDPLDQQAVTDSPTRYLVAVTCGQTGKSRYLEPRAPEMLTPLKGSCALPLLYRGPVEWQGQSLLDGGLLAPVPAQHAHALGARRLVVVRTRPSGLTKSTDLLTRLTAALVRNPVARAAMLEAADAYQDATRFIGSPPGDCELVEIAPPEVLATSRTTQDVSCLEQDYALGQQAGRQALPALRSMLGDRP